MIRRVSPDIIEDVVGAKRHPLNHIGRAISDTFFILHSQECFNSDAILCCEFSEALSCRPSDDVWDMAVSAPVTLGTTSDGHLVVQE